MRDVRSLPLAEEGEEGIAARFTESGAPEPATYPVKKSGEKISVRYA